MTLMDRLSELNRELYSAHTGIGFGVIASSKQTAVPIVGGWVELARTTLGSNNAVIDVTGLADKRYYMALLNYEITGASNNTGYELNGDSGNNYAQRHNVDGTSEQTHVNQQTIRNQGNDSPIAGEPNFDVGYFANLSAEEKLYQGWGTKQKTAGAGTPPTRSNSVGKWDIVTGVLDQIKHRGDQGTSITSITGSELVILGWSPADTHTTNFWEQIGTASQSSGAATFNVSLDSGKKYIWAQVYWTNTSAGNGFLRVGNSTIDTGSNYSGRRSADGAADSTDINQNAIQGVNGNGQANIPRLTNIFIVNKSAEEKLFIIHTVDQDNAGATAPNRGVAVAKWVNTSNLIDILGLFVSAGNIGAGAEWRVWGSD